MRQRNRLDSPTLIIALIALFVAMGGTVYAAKKINGKTIKVKSLPGNRLKPRSVPANRLKPGVLTSAGIAGPITGAQINESTLGMVPNAAHAVTADTAASATDAQTALNAVNAINADKVNGHSAGCFPGTIPFAGACWQSSDSELAATAPDAATKCAQQGGALPGALELATFAKQSGVTLDASGEWADDVTEVTGPNLYAVLTVLPNAIVESALSTSLKHYRCVIPLLR